MNIQNTTETTLEIAERKLVMNESDCLTAIRGFIKQVLNREVLATEYHAYINEWLLWYKGKVESFHTYNHFNGHRYKKCNRFSLGLPKQICEQWASLLYNDKVCFNLDSDTKAGSAEFDDNAILKEILEKNKFSVKFNNLVEMYMALGTGATTEYKDAKGNVKINYIYAPMIFPLEVENGEIVSCAFGSYTGNEYFVEVHQRQDNDTYKINNYHFVDKASESSKYEVIQKDGVVEEYVSEVKMFQIYTPNIKNNISIFSPFGISVYGNALDEIKTADLVYDSFKNEFLLGKKKIFLREGAVNYKIITDEKGQPQTVPIFDENETEFFAIQDVDDEGGKQKLIEESNPQLRVQEHTEGMQTALNTVGKAVGFGLDYFTFKGNGTYQNTTQIISTKSELYTNIKQHEKVLDGALKDLIKAVMYLRNNATYEKDITIDFDDSIVEDSAEVKRQALLELNAGIIDNVQYYQDVYKMTKEQAIKFDEEIRNRKTAAEPAEPLIDEDSDEEFITTGRQTAGREEEQAAEENEPDKNPIDKNPIKEAIKKPADIADQEGAKQARGGLIRIKTKK
nr:MAG TPA: portal protein [Caudoviricetes sp.]